MASILEFLETPYGRKFQQVNTVLLPKFMEKAKKEIQKLSESIDERLAAMGYK
jgi:hypothetical protein